MDCAAVVLGVEGNIRSAFAVETGSKIVVVSGWRAAWSQVCRAGDDQFASVTKALGRGEVREKMLVASSWIVSMEMVSRMDMSAMARARSLFVLFMATYWAGRVLMPVVGMPSDCSWLRAARPLRSSPTALWRWTNEPRR